MPCFPSEQFPHSAPAWWPVYGTPESSRPMPGNRGAKPTPKRLPPADLPYAQVVTRRTSGRGVEGTTQLICGSEEAVPARWAAARVRQTIHPSCVARNPLPGRQGNGRLARQGRSFSKDLPGVETHLWWSLASSPCVRPQDSWSQP